MIIDPLEEISFKYELKSNDENNDEQYILEVLENILEKYANDVSKEKEKESIELLIKERVYSNIKIKNKTQTIKNINDRVFGYHILQKFIDDETVSDIRTTSFSNIFIKRSGRWSKADESFFNDKDYINFVRYCVYKNGGKINTENPIIVVSDRKNNLRIEAGIEPINVVSPNLVIRIHRKNNVKTLEELVINDSNIINVDEYKFLNKCINEKLNIVISGKGGSGKTTLMRAIINKIPASFAITSNEETAELFCNHQNMIQREIIQNRNEEKNINLQKLSKQALVMSNDVIVVGELKGEETMMFLDAVSTGHVGYATVHSNSSLDTVDRLIILMKRDVKAQLYSEKYLKQILAKAIDVIIFMKDYKVKEIVKLDYDNESEKIIYQFLFKAMTKTIGESSFEYIANAEVNKY